MGTGKEQKIDIKSSSGLTDEEIERMQQDAKAHEEEDKKHKEIIEERNKGEALIYQAQKTIKDLGDKADAEKVKKSMKRLPGFQETLKGEDAEKMKADAEALTKPLYEMTSKMYEAASTTGCIGSRSCPTGFPAEKEIG